MAAEDRAIQREEQESQTLPFLPSAHSLAHPQHKPAHNTFWKTTRCSFYNPGMWLALHLIKEEGNPSRS